MSIVSVDPTVAALLAQTIALCADGCRPDEHVRIAQYRANEIEVGISSGFVVRAKRTVVAYHDRPGGCIRWTFKEGDRVHDNEGDHGTVIRVYEDGMVLVDGDAGTKPWRYLARELTKDYE